MPIQVYERFDWEKGDLWNEITWDFMMPTWRNTSQAQLVSTGWKLRCDFRLPATGVFRFMHPVNDEAIEFIYETFYITIPNHIPGDLSTAVFTEEIKNKWEALPKEWTCKIGPMTLTAVKDIPDKIEMDNTGKLYLYRPTEIRVE